MKFVKFTKFGGKKVLIDLFSILLVEESPKSDSCYIYSSKSPCDDGIVEVTESIEEIERLLSEL